MKFSPLLGALLLFSTQSVFAKTIQLQEMRVSIPTGWNVTQEARDQETLFVSLEKGSSLISLYARPESLGEMQNWLSAENEVLSDALPNCLPKTDFKWNFLRALKRAKNPTEKTYYVTAFKTELSGVTYFGYHRSEMDDGGDEAGLFVQGISRLPNTSSTRSLTGPDYTGKKYYFGFADAHPGSQQMVNEVKYDIQHTHDIFTRELGGGYIGEKIFGDYMPQTLLAHWASLRNKMTSGDMYVQYSSGHGLEGGLGLAVGLKYTTIRDNVLSLPAKELIVFMMACESGYLVNAFNEKKQVWKDWPSQGRTLMVMTSSAAGVNSYGGPGWDPQEPNGPLGSAGSAFGHALWKALIGYADGAVDGIKDGFISLGEIRDYTTRKTQQIGKHTPVVTGAYAASLIMNRVPPKAWLARLENTTEGLSDEQIMEKIRALDQSMRVK